jgi:hypothetical protein
MLPGSTPSNMLLLLLLPPLLLPASDGSLLVPPPLPPCQATPARAAPPLGLLLVARAP